jgi:TPR repeat protein
MRVILLLLISFATTQAQVPSNDITRLSPTELRVRAQKGDAAAQYHLGSLLRSTNFPGIKQDYVEAMKWMKKAHDQGYLPATHAMGDFYQLGWGVGKDQGVAMKYFREAATKGFPAAQAMLGRLYISGSGVSTNKSEGMKWLNLALNQREVSAPLSLAYYAENGLFGFRKDKVQATAYYAVGIEFGAKGGPETKLEELKSQLTPEQKAEAIKRTKAILLTVPPAKGDAPK